MLPKTLKYQSKVESAYARSVRSNIQPQTTGPFNLGDTIVINLPTRAGLALIGSESYLRFTVNITNGTADNAFRWDSCGASGIIQRLRSFSGSNALEDLDNYGMCAKMLYDLQLPDDAVRGKFNVMSGCRADLVSRTINNFPAVAMTNAAMAGTSTTATEVNTALTALTLSINTALATATATNISSNQINSGERIDPAGAVLGAGATLTATYCIPLISIFGVLCTNNYFPLWECTSSPIRLELTLVDSLLKAMNVKINTTASTCTITNVEYIASMLELSDPAISMIKDSLGGQPLQFVVPSWRNYAFNNTLTNGSTASIAFPIAAKFSSVKSIFVTCRDIGLGAASYFPFSSTSRNILQYQFRIGSEVMPSKAPSTPVEMFVECMKAIGSFSDINQQPSIEKASYTLVSSGNTGALLDSATSVSSQHSGSFYIGIDLETYANSDKTQIFSGYNTNTSDIYCMIDYGTQTGNTAPNCRFDAYCNFDSVLVCQNDTCYVRF